jgi:hypothetical protein
MYTLEESCIKIGAPLHYCSRILYLDNKFVQSTYIFLPHRDPKYRQGIILSNGDPIQSDYQLACVTFGIFAYPGEFHDTNFFDMSKRIYGFTCEAGMHKLLDLEIEYPNQGYGKLLETLLVRYQPAEKPVGKLRSLIHPFADGTLINLSKIQARVAALKKKRDIKP